MKPQSEVKCSRVANVKTSKCKVVKSLKPLVNFRFYLDIEKHNVSLKIESKIKELGGSIEFLLTKDVTHFITDRVLENKDPFVNSPSAPASPRTSLSNYSETGSNASAGNDSKRGGKIKSRADAMLQRARKVTTESERPPLLSRSPSQVARRWGTPIWDTEHALKYFDKVYNAIKEHYKGEFPPKSKEKAGNAKVLKGNFIKIESFHKQYRPYYNLLKGKWPEINLQSDENIGAFAYANDRSSRHSRSVKATQGNLQESKKSQDSTMTRKNRSTKHIRVQPSSRITSEKQCGFCEICRVEYDVLTVHLKTDEHVNYVKNDRNFLELDSLIKSSANVNKFLSINKTLFNGSDCEIFPKRSRRHTATNNRYVHNNSQSEVEPVKTAIVELGKKSLSEPNNYSRYTRQSFSRQSINLPPQSLVNRNEGDKKSQSEIMGAVVRARRESVKKINYAEAGEEDEENSNDAIFSNLQSKRTKVAKPAIVKIEESPDVKSKRPISTVMYKVVDAKTDNALDKKEPLAEKNSEQPAPLIVKFRKVRQTELAILNGEAVNFMFPPKMSSDIPTDVDRHTTSESRTTHSSDFSSSEKICGTSKRKSSIVSQGTEDSRDSSSGKRKKVNNSFTEPASNNVIADQEKLEDSGCDRRVKRNRKRRFRRAPIQPRGRRRIKQEPAEPEEEQAVTQIVTSPPEDRMGEKKEVCNLASILQNELGKYKFAFERVPYSEPWYDVFHRQDECKEETFEYYGNTVYRKLPYEMGPLPPLPANCSCLQSKSEGDKPSNPDLPINAEQEDSSSSNTEQNESETASIKMENPRKSKSPNKKKKKYKRPTAAILNMEMPRKSPREHPSTLAILSCLINRREDKSSNVRKAEKTEEEKSSTAPKKIEKVQEEKPATAQKDEKSEEDTPKPNEVEIRVETPKEQTTMQISPQIGESVKRLRRGEKLLENKRIKCEPIPDKIPPKIKRAVGRPRKQFTLLKPAETNPNEKRKARQQEFVDVNRLQRKIDLFLSLTPSHLDFDEDEGLPISEDKNEIVDNFRYETNLSELVLNNAHANDATNASNANPPKAITSRLRFYKLFTMNKKVKVNRTGWPKKRRVITRQQNTVKMPVLNGLATTVDIPNQTVEKLNNEVEIPTQSPITPPETDVEDKNECDCNSVTTALRDENTNLTFASDRAENSDMFTVSSDSLDTVLDVGSQIKTEIQKEIIASRKCKVNICNKLPPDVKIRKSSRISFRRGKHLYLSRSVHNVKTERPDVEEESEPCTPHSVTPTDITMKTSSSPTPSQQRPIKSSPALVCPISPRRLRKPRGRWYRER